MNEIYYVKNKATSLQMELKLYSGDDKTIYPLGKLENWFDKWTNEKQIDFCIENFKLKQNRVEIDDDVFIFKWEGIKLITNSIDLLGWICSAILKVEVKIFTDSEENEPEVYRFEIEMKQDVDYHSYNMEYLEAVAYKIIEECVWIDFYSQVKELKKVLGV